MNFKTTIFLLVLLAAAGVYLGVSHLGKSSEENAPAQKSTAKLIDADSNDVTRILVTPADGKQMVLEKTGATWRMLEPVNAPADTFNVEDLARQLTGLQSRGELKTDKLTSSGLEHPRYSVELTAKGKAYKLALGDKNEIGDTLYARLNDRDKIDIVPSAVYDQLKKPAKTYRSTKLVNVSTDQVRQLAFTRLGKMTKLEKQGNDWQVIEPTKMPADSTAVSDLLFAITGLNAAEFVEGQSTSQSYGLDNPATTVWFSTIAPSTQPTTSAATQPAGTEIKFGSFDDILKSNVYATIGGGPVVKVSATTVQSFNKTPLDLRDKKVVDIDPAHVENFTLSVDRPATTQPTTQPADQHEYAIARRKESTPVLGPTLAPPTQPASTHPTTQPLASTQPVATQPASKWVFQSGGNGDADEGQVQALLDGLHPLRAEKYHEKNPATLPAGSYTLTVHSGPSGGHGGQDCTIRFTSPGATGPAVGSYNDLIFDLDRSILEKLEGDFKTKKAAPPAPSFNGAPPGGFSP